AARRPTVTSALTALAKRGLVRPTDAGWVLSGDTPGLLHELPGRESSRRSDGARNGAERGPAGL
ncbi:MAG: hypothetical protein ACLQBB_08675, partial [Solirubrobacteraceae bacterium]